MRLRHIEVFHAIYSTGSITNAAQMLHVSQPSISKVLHHAEIQLGFELFHRVKGKLIPTDEAKALIGDVNKVYQQINSLKKTARNLKDNLHGHVSIAVMPALGLNILPLAIRQFHQRYPEITFDVHTKHFDDVVKSIFEYEIDVGLVFNPVTQAGLSEYAIGAAELVCVHPKDAFPGNPERLSPSDLADRKLVTITDSGPLGDIITTRLAQADVYPDAYIKSQTYYIAKNLVSYGLGVSIVDEFTAYAEGPGKVEITRFEPPIEFSLKALYLENKPLPKVCRNFLECFQTIYNETKARH